jgi:transposase-like protein
MMENGKRRKRRQLSPEEKWELFLEVTSQELSQADAARKWSVVAYPQRRRSLGPERRLLLRQELRKLEPAQSSVPPWTRRRKPAPASQGHGRFCIVPAERQFRCPRQGGLRRRRWTHGRDLPSTRASYRLLIDRRSSVADAFVRCDLAGQANAIVSYQRGGIVLLLLGSASTGVRE